jgi:predicted nucleotidyltransferase
MRLRNWRLAAGSASFCQKIVKSFEHHAGLVEVGDRLGCERGKLGANTVRPLFGLDDRTTSSKRRGKQVERESAKWRRVPALPATAITRLRLDIPSRYRERVIDDATIDEAGRRLSDATPPGTRVILFGSHARGEAGKHSDLDFLVIEPSVEHPASESVRLRRALGDLVIAADVIVVSEQRAASSELTSGAMCVEV